MQNNLKSKLPGPSRRAAMVSLFALALTAPGLAACGGKGEGEAEVLRVGDQKGGMRSLLEASGELKDVPYKIEWSDMPAASPLLEAMSVGAIDVGASSAPPFIFAYSNGAQIRAIMVSHSLDPTGEVRKGNAILVPADSPLKTLADLRGKKVATVKGSIGQDLVLRLLDKAGIDFKDVEFVYLNNGEAKAALSTGAIDAWSTWSPYTGIAVVEDHDRVLADARELPPSSGGFWSANVKSLETKKPLLRDFIQRYLRARRWAVNHREEFAQMRSKVTGVPVEAIRYGASAASLMELKVIDDSVIDEQRAIFERYKRAGVISQVPNLNAAGAYDNSFNDLFVANARASAKTPG
jgi:sulfonate transport system substrate-binding protein